MMEKIKQFIREEVTKMEDRIITSIAQVEARLKEHVKEEVNKEWCAEPYEDEIRAEENFHLISASDEQPCTTPVPPNSPQN